MATNLLANGNAETGTNAGFGTTQGTLTNVTTTPYEGSRAFKFNASGTGNRNFQSTPPMACNPGDVFSVEGYTRWLTGTAKQISVMVQFLDSSLVQTGNFIGTLVTPGTGAYSKVESLNATAPALTTQVRFQGRINAAAIGDEALFDDLWMNAGATIDRSTAPPPPWSVWNGTTEIPAVSVTVWNGSVELAIVDTPEPVTDRSPWVQPFADNSIWNTPIGTGATRVAAGLSAATFHAADWVTVDPIDISFDTSFPIKTLTRGDASDPTVYVDPTMAHSGSFNGIAVFRGTDGNYYEGQPMTLTVGGSPSWPYSRPVTGNVRGDGIAGSHGGARVGGLGGTIRKWEWDSTGPIQHALAINLYGRRFLSTTTSGYRWPATHADTGYNTDKYPGQSGVGALYTANGTDNWYGRTGTGYDGMKMGTLLALPTAYNIAAITNAKVKRIATALRDFGAYVVDNTARDVHAFSVETTAQSAWEGSGATFHAELMTVISALQYIDNNTISTIGGGGTPIAAPPPPLEP